MKTSFSQTGFLLSSLLVSFVQANDPADSWLVYSKAAGKGSKVLSVNATWVVPDYPSVRGGGNAPGWWFGIEPNPADVLIQPILAYGDGSPEFTILSELSKQSLTLAKEVMKFNIYVKQRVDFQYGSQ